MRTIFAGLAAALILAPAAASAQYYEAGYGYRRTHDHVEVYRHGDHDDVVVRHHHPRPDYDRPVRHEGWRHHHHHDLDD
ncbi:hypothetical protein [Methylorubrum thiocyanatum]|uniref:hypothetical protein n=1 Tax=Methylorubrum thiocyanatum TaxID=47958 RepID=UPI0035C78BC6